MSQASPGSWWERSRAVYGAELRAAAMCLVDHGWPVLPGTRWHGSRAVGGHSGWESVPSVPGGVSAATRDPAQVARWWSEAPHSVLVATGEALDAISVPAWMGRRMTVALRTAGLVAPLVGTPTGRWWFPVAAGSAALPSGIAAAGVQRHGEGSWVIAPPSECADGLVHWRVIPAACGWQPADAQWVLTAAAEAIRWRVLDGEGRSPATRPAGVASG